MRPRRRWRSVVTAMGLLIAIVVCVFGVKGLQIGKMMTTKMVMPPTTVSSATVKEEDWAPTLSAVGSISAVQGAVVSAELAGIVSEISFESGAAAKKGDVLMKLDTSQEEALLRSSAAEAQLARADLERSRDLAMKKVVSSAELDSAQSKFTRLNAVVDQMRSNIAKKTLIAPFDGQLGIRQVNVGQMINAGQQVVPLTSLDPVFADFALPQQYFGQLKPGLDVHVTTDALPGRVFDGKVTAINSMVDSSTRNITVQATLDNADHALRPGMFAKTEVMLPEKHKALVVPGSAISYAPFGDSVFVIEKKKDEKTGKESQVIRQQFVRVGEGRGDLVAITQGLKAGETIVSTGVFKLRNGMTVTINNDLAPNPQVNPHPIDS
ncbi:MAG TPA: efflux RND transporter periplasmic adaptor subunit [Candidatus Udaeobacter sp.]|nr:efflux RND transporter periplasmic adaptor subunit [Candidatus Udaeobacter sp.]